jgi:hypothetical protein
MALTQNKYGEAVGIAMQTKSAARPGQSRFAEARIRLLGTFERGCCGFDDRSGSENRQK